MLFQNKLLVGSIAAIGMTCTSNAAMVMMYLNSASGVSSSTQSYGAAFEGTMQWSYNSGSTAQITVNLTNTSTVTSYLAAFVVGLQNTSFGLTQTSAPTAFNQLTSNNALKANPFGDYDWGSGSTSSFSGGGTGNNGIAQGQSGTWVFSVSGTASSLAAVNSAAVFNGVNNWDFVAHIKGISDRDDDDDEDSTVSEKLTSGIMGSVTPGPATISLLALAGAMKRRRRG